jgi:hypothetical protein
MPRKTIKVVKEDSIEKDDQPESPKESLEEPKPVKVKKERTPKQIEAFNKALEKRKQNALEKKALKETAVDIPKEVEMTEIPKEVKKRGRPSLSPEKIEEKATLKEVALQKQLEKLQKKVEQSAKKEAKKQVLQKIKSKMEDDNDDVDLDTDDDTEINEIVKKQKKPIVILNKIDNGKMKKQHVPQPTAIFV